MILSRIRTAARAAIAGWRYPLQVEQYIDPNPPTIHIEADRTERIFKMADGKLLIVAHYVVNIPIHGPLHGRTEFHSPTDKVNQTRTCVPGDVLNLSVGTTVEDPQ